MVQKDRFPLRWDFCFQCTLVQHKIWKKQIKSATLSPCNGKASAWWYGIPKFTKFLSSPNFHYLKQFPQKEGHKKKYPSYKCRHCSMGSQTTNRRESRLFCDTFPENPALGIELCFKLKLSKIECMRSDLTVTKYWFMYNVFDNDPYEEWLDCFKTLIYV